MPHSPANDALEGILLDWGKWIAQGVKELGYPTMCAFAKQTYGCRTLPIPSYWPDPVITNINRDIMGLSAKYRDALVAFYCYQYRGARLGRELGCSRWQALRRVNQAKRYL